MSASARIVPFVAPLRRVRARLVSGAVVLMYHRIAELAADPWRLCVSPERFSEQLEVLRRLGRPLALRELVNGLATGRVPRRAVVVTFDDGYADNATAARPLLERSDVPATVFVTSGQLAESREFWWDELERLLLHSAPLPGELTLEVCGTAHRFTLSAPPPDAAGLAAARGWIAWEGEPPSERHALFRMLYARLQPLAPGERDHLMAQLGAWSGRPPEVRPSHRTLCPAELRSLADGGLVEIGAHSVSHLRLADAAPDVQRDEIRRSRAQLEALLERPVVLFAYPYGRREDYDATSVAAVRAAGFESACGNFPGRVERGTDPFQIPRFHPQDWDGDTFERHLSEWLDA